MQRASQPKRSLRGPDLLCEAADAKGGVSCAGYVQSEVLALKAVLDEERSARRALCEKVTSLQNANKSLMTTVAEFSADTGAAVDLAKCQSRALHDLAACEANVSVLEEKLGAAHAKAAELHINIGRKETLLASCGSDLKSAREELECAKDNHCKDFASMTSTLRQEMQLLKDELDRGAKMYAKALASKAMLEEQIAKERTTFQDTLTRTGKSQNDALWKQRMLQVRGELEQVKRERDVLRRKRMSGA